MFALIRAIFLHVFLFPYIVLGTSLIESIGSEGEVTEECLEFNVFSSWALLFRVWYNWKKVHFTEEKDRNDRSNQAIMKPMTSILEGNLLLSTRGVSTILFSHVQRKSDLKFHEKKAMSYKSFSYKTYINEFLMIVQFANLCCICSSFNCNTRILYQWCDIFRRIK